MFVSAIRRSAALPVLVISPGSAASRNAARYLAAGSATSNATTDDLFKFVAESLELKGIKGKSAADEIAKLKANQIVSMDMLKSLSMHDWEKSGVSFGAARAIQDAMWNAKQNEAMSKINLRRENSTKQELKQRRL